ncbi:DUF4401 domain-containing protein [Rhodococcus erythropolis]|uniref:hypothetical protein n=1 Tax=Rhodococcus erythropolis TaxID=1833 RepID=UPI001C9AEF82|nr:hypothetical protein [Rhodococcus erythropolis]MBY6382368.1 DUF4401 domain-containing protein [Rhodococcus erythropolis]
MTILGNTVAAALLSVVAGLAAWLPWWLHSDGADTSRQQVIVLLGAGILAVVALGLAYLRTPKGIEWNHGSTLLPATTALLTLAFTANRLGADLLSPWTIGTIALIVLALVELLTFVWAPVLALAISPTLLAVVWWGTSPLPLAIGALTSILVLAALWYFSSGDGWAPLVVGLTVIGLVAVSTMIGVAFPKHSPAISATLARAMIHPEVSVLQDSANFGDTQPILPWIRAIAASDSGTTMALVTPHSTTAELWKFDSTGADPLVVGRSASTPTGRPLLPDDADTKYADRITESLGGTEDSRAALPATRALAFDGDTLYGLSDTTLWRLEGTNTIRTVHRWDSAATRSFAVIAPTTAAVLTKSPNNDYTLDFFNLEDGTVLGSPTLPPHHDNEADEQRATTGYVGPTATSEGKFLLFFDTRLQEFSPSEDYTTLTAAPLDVSFSAEYAISKIEAGKDRLMVTTPSGTTILYDNFRGSSPLPQSPKINTETPKPGCAARADATSISYAGIFRGTFSPDGSQMAVVQNVAQCTDTLLATTTDGDAPWIALNRVQPRGGPAPHSTDRYVLGPLAATSNDSSVAIAPFTLSFIERDDDGAYQVRKLPPRRYFNSSIYAFAPVGDTYWAAGHFVTESEPEGEWALLLGTDGNWVPAPAFQGVRDPGRNVRDITAYSDQSAIVAFCDEIRIYNLTDQSTTPVFTRTSARSNCDRKTDPGPIESWPSTVGIPQAVDVAVAADSENVLYVADTKSTPDGSTVWFGITAINPKTGAAAPLPGADLTDLHAAPIDVAVSETGNVCIATAHADRFGPLTVVIDGRLRLVDTDTSEITGCGWNGNSIVATTAAGEVIQYDARDFATKSTTFVP